MQAYFDQDNFNNEDNHFLEQSLDYNDQTPLEGEIGYNAGKKDLWYKLGNEKENVALTLQKERYRSYSLFLVTRSKNTLKIISKQIIHPGTRFIFSPREANDYFLHFAGEAHKNLSKFKIIREDFNLQRYGHVSVLDRVNLTESKTLFLLPKTEHIKAGAHVLLKGRSKSDSAFKSLGRCQVQETEDGLTNCTLEAKVPPHFNHFRAEYRLEGRNI